MNSQQPKVLIVGAGPTGLTAALELSRLQIPIRGSGAVPASLIRLETFSSSRISKGKQSEWRNSTGASFPAANTISTLPAIMRDLTSSKRQWTFPKALVIAYIP
jgi:glycine/D-amino acid oxidase-like deaminating enzyme